MAICISKFLSFGVLADLGSRLPDSLAPDLLEITQALIFSAYGFSLIHLPWTAILTALVVVKSVTLIFLLRALWKDRRKVGELSDKLGKLEMAAEASGSGAWLWDSNNPGQPSWISAQAQKLLYPEGGLPTAHSIHPANIHPDDCTAVERAWKRLRKGQGDLDLTFRLLLPDGRIHWILEKGRSTKDKNGSTRIFGTVTDVTPSESVNLQTGALRDELSRRHQHDLWTVFADTAEEIGGGLASIRNQTENAQNLLRSGRSEPAAKALSQIHIDVSAMIRRITKFPPAPDHPAKKRPLSPNELLESVQRLMQHEARMNRCVVSTSLSPEIPFFSGDFLALHQVLYELILNGFEAMKDTPEEQKRVIIKTAMTPEGRVEISVSDQGPGIPGESKPHLFERFFTTKPGHAGLGLPAAQSILADHDSRLEMIEKPLGTCFRFLMPVGNGHE